jgi:hypothetical protein
MKTRLLPLIAILVLGCLAARPALAAGQIRINVVPNVLLADGQSTAIVTAEVRGANGRPVRDGTEVRFYTTAGSITPVTFTQAGVARATLTASAVPQAANVSVSVGVDQALSTVPMVSSLVEANVGGRVLKVSGKYVAFSEDKRYIQADDQVKVTFRGVEIQSNSAQIDINANTIKALGKVQISSDDKVLVGDRLWLDLRTFEGYVMAVGTRRWFSAYGLTDLPEKPKNANPDFDLVDLSESKLMWIGRQANYIVDERVQVQGARAYVAGVRSFRMPFHQVNLTGGFNETEQYVGLGSQGLTLDLPLYLRMTPGSSTAVRLGYGSRSGGLGYFTRNQGLSVDLVQRYGFSGASEGEASLTNLSSFGGWGAYWNHTQQFNKTTRLVSSIQFPQHRDIYGQFNLTSGLPIGRLQASLAAQKPQAGRLANTLSLAFETKPRQLANNRVALTGETTFFRRDPQRLPVPGNLYGRRRLAVQETQFVAAGVRARPQPTKLPYGFTLDSSAALRGVMGMGNVNTGIGPAFETNLRRPLGNNGFMSIGLNYNPLITVNDFFPNQGRLNSTFNITYPITSRLRLAAFGSLSLDSPNRHNVLQASYQFAPKWRLDLFHTMYRFGGFSDFDLQFGISRAIGNRELGIYWSRSDHRFFFEFGAARF